MKIQILGTGCPKCRLLAALARQAAEDLHLDCEIEKITDLDEILRQGVLLTPALVVDGEVKAAGVVPSLAEMKRLLSDGG